MSCTSLLAKKVATHLTEVPVVAVVVELLFIIWLVLPQPFYWPPGAVVEQAPPLPANPRFFLVDLAAGASVSVPWDYTTTFRPADLVFRLDPANVVSECSEAGAKSCGGTSLIRQTVLRVCSACDLTAICASPSVEVCDGAPVALEGSATGLCVGGSLEFRWEDDGGIAFPGCDWNPSPTCIVNPGGLSPGIHLLTFRVRCSVSACESSCTEIVNVLANRMPPPYGNTLRAVRRDADVGLLWILPLGSDISAHRVYQDQDRRLPVATRTRLLEVAVPTATHVNGVVLPPQPIGYYQVVGLSCLGDLEGPY